MKNQVSDDMQPVTINVYEGSSYRFCLSDGCKYKMIFIAAKKQSQLSVVVVPVAFTLVAVILVVFGVSYYLQSRNR